jgi:hypothetical protein
MDSAFVVVGLSSVELMKHEARDAEGLRNRAFTSYRAAIEVHDTGPVVESAYELVWQRISAPGVVFARSAPALAYKGSIDIRISIDLSSRIS